VEGSWRTSCRAQENLWLLKSLVRWMCSCTVHWFLRNISKYHVHKFCNERMHVCMNERTDMWRTLCLCLPIWPTGGIKSPHDNNCCLLRHTASTFSRHGMPLPASDDTGTALGQDGSYWSCDLASLTLDVMVPVADVSRRPPYRKFEICRP